MTYMFILKCALKLVEEIIPRECLRNDVSNDASIYVGADTFRLNKAAYRKASQSVLAM